MPSHIQRAKDNFQNQVNHITNYTFTLLAMLEEIAYHSRTTAARSGADFVQEVCVILERGGFDTSLEADEIVSAATDHDTVLEMLKQIIKRGLPIPTRLPGDTDLSYASILLDVLEDNNRKAKVND